jgi:hypothetical protein
VTVSGDSSAVPSRYEWTFESAAGGSFTTTSNTATYRYSSGGNKTVTVKVVFTDGRELTVGKQVNVQ